MNTYMNSATGPQTPLSIDFCNDFVENLPGDPILENSLRQVEHACYSHVTPTPVVKPVLASYSKESALLLDLTEEDCLSHEFLEVMAGNKLLDGMTPFAMCYGGHQFGNWAGQLGDGRAINLGEMINNGSERWMLQLKGAGLTPYSRSADGLAVLRSSLREFVCSEAMHHLGVPTTRALSLVLTGEQVVRDMFYDGNPKPEPGAVVCRLSPSFTRFGNFEILAAQNDVELLKKLVCYTINTDFPHLKATPSIDNYLEWFAEICSRTAEMVIHWMRVGFVHGVMNTDNMSILGLTIDYGPYGWLENYDPSWTPNTTDAQGRRYCYGNQPYMAQWNLSRLANAIQPLIGEGELLQEPLDIYRKTFQNGWMKTIAHKVGFFEHDPDDEKLITDLLDLLSQTETDMTIFFRLLAEIKSEDDTQQLSTEHFKPAYYAFENLTPEYCTNMGTWLAGYRARLKKSTISDRERKKKMNRINPKFVFRNYLAQLAIDKAEQGDFSMIDELLETFRNPYSEQPKREAFAARRPEWARNRAGCSMLSCSS